jgi:hypothetical protein
MRRMHAQYATQLTAMQQRLQQQPIQSTALQQQQLHTSSINNYQHNVQPQRIIVPYNRQYYQSQQQPSSVYELQSRQHIMHNAINYQQQQTHNHKIPHVQHIVLNASCRRPSILITQNSAQHAGET